MLTTVDPTTAFWIRNASDEKAAANGCHFDLERAAWVVYWIEKYCRLYEGSHAGEPLMLRGAWSQPMKAIEDPWSMGGREKHIKRLHEYEECVKAGEPVDWQYEAVTQLFGWVKYSERWEREIRRYRKGSIYVAKKNKKSPTLAAIALYLTCGDNEPGQKVYLAAKNGFQARDIAGQHALEMVRASGSLSAECEVNMNRMRITHTPTHSWLQPLASSDDRSQKAAEGLNGSVMVDECHVVDREFMARISRTGISRMEPFLLHFSTAGNDPDSYGYEQWQYGSDNNKSGLDESYYFLTHEAPQTLTAAQLDKDFEKYIRMANPAIGNTIDLEEVRQDYLASKISLNKLAEFMMYRLNVWQRAANPWISMSDWNVCRSLYTRESLEKQPCCAGLDMGYVDDMTALSLVFPQDPEAWNKAKDATGRAENIAEAVTILDQPVKVLTWFWLPESAVEKYGHEVQYKEWASKGLLTVQPTPALDPALLLTDIRELLAKYDVQAVAFDPWHAGVVITALKEEDGWPEEMCWEFLQNSIKNWVFPCALFERLIISGKLQHQGHEILDWQVGHVQVKEDGQGGVRPIKPGRNTRKKIDGVAATVMALDALARKPYFATPQCVILE
jgi:phage terminase large subunit-like protein